MTLKIEGQVRGGKNNMGITRSGIHYPYPKWAAWRDGVVASLLAQRRELLGRPCRIKVFYTPGDKRRRDVPGLADAICHCLERAKIVLDDSLFVDWEWTTFMPDKLKAGATIVIEPR